MDAIRDRVRFEFIEERTIAPYRRRGLVVDPAPPPFDSAPDEIELGPPPWPRHYWRIQSTRTPESLLVPLVPHGGFATNVEEVLWLWSGG